MYAVRWQPVILHRRAPNPRNIQLLRASQKRDHGPKQEERDPLRFLLRRVLQPGGCGDSQKVTQFEGTGR